MGSTSGQTKGRSVFVQDTKRVLNRLQSGFGEILDALPGQMVRPQEFSRHLKIDKQLAWRIVKVARSTDPFAVGKHVPGQAALKLFLEAVEKSGVPAVLIKEASDAFAEFEELVRIHASGDRAALEMMLTARAEKDRQTADLSHRRMAFRGNSYIWGVQAKIHLKLGIMQPSSVPGMADTVSVNGFYNLCQLREGVPLAMARLKILEYDKNGRRLFTYEPIEQNAEQDAAALARDAEQELEVRRDEGLQGVGVSRANDFLELVHEFHEKRIGATSESG